MNLITVAMLRPRSAATLANSSLAMAVRGPSEVRRSRIVMRITPFALLAVSAVSQAPTWNLISPSSPAPAPRRIENAFAPADGFGNYLLFGGRDTSNNNYSDTWTFNGTSWTQHLGVGPAARYGHCLAYDSSHQHVVMFGGVDDNGATLSETWTWDGQQWSQHSPSLSPPARQHGTIVDFPPLSSALLVAGRLGQSRFNDTWAWDGSSWTQLSVPSYSGRSHQNATYDPSRGIVVMFGGEPSPSTYLGDTWEFDGVGWTSPLLGHSPTARHTPSMCYSASVQAVLLFGGESNCTPKNDLWRYGGGGWTELQLNGTTNGPSRRGGAGMVFDAAADRAILVHGRTQSCSGHSDSSEVWSLALTPAATFSPFGNGCPGSAGTPTLSRVANGLPSIGTTSQLRLAGLSQSFHVAIFVIGFSTSLNSGPLGSYALPLDLGALGIPGCTQYVSDDFTTFVLAVAGQADWPLTVPHDTGLLGLELHVQGLSHEPQASIVALSNAVTATVGY